jgi:hypothetical protein
VDTEKGLNTIGAESSVEGGGSAALAGAGCATVVGAINAPRASATRGMKRRHRALKQGEDGGLETAGDEFMGKSGAVCSQSNPGMPMAFRAKFKHKLS